MIAESWHRFCSLVVKRPWEARQEYEAHVAERDAAVREAAEAWDAVNELRQRVADLEADLPILGRCSHGVDLDREFCPEGCRV